MTHLYCFSGGEASSVVCVSKPQRWFAGIPWKSVWFDIFCMATPHIPWIMDPNTQPAGRFVGGGGGGTFGKWHFSSVPPGSFPLPVLFKNNNSVSPFFFFNLLRPTCFPRRNNFVNKNRHAVLFLSMASLVTRWASPMCQRDLLLLLLLLVYDYFSISLVCVQLPSMLFSNNFFF